MNLKTILSTILVILWMVTIFNFSNQKGAGSGNTSQKVTTIIVNIIDIPKKMTEETKQEVIKKLEPYVRKFAHYTLYTIGGFLIINCTYAFKIMEKKSVYLSGIIGILYAVSDELHQLFINGRSGKIEDVIIDTIGIFTGIVIYIFIRKVVEIIKAKSKPSKGGEKVDC